MNEMGKGKRKKGGGERMDGLSAHGNALKKQISDSGASPEEPKNQQQHSQWKNAGRMTVGNRQPTTMPKRTEFFKVLRSSMENDGGRERGGGEGGEEANSR